LRRAERRKPPGYSPATTRRLTPANDFRIVALDALVRKKLIAHRLIDRAHLRDMIGVGLIDAT
jgi:hypothetical protein